MLEFLKLSIDLYRHFYRKKTTAFAGAGDGVKSRGVNSSGSIVNYRTEAGSFEPILPYILHHNLPNYDDGIGIASCVNINYAEVRQSTLN